MEENHVVQEELEVIDIVQTATGSNAYVLYDPEGHFDHKVGQFVKIYFDPNVVVSYAQSRLSKGEITQEILDRIKVRAQHNFREFSITNPPTRSGYIELLIEKAEDGSFSPWFLDNVKVGDMIKVEGPLGRFIFDDSNKNACFLAAGSGIAPLMCMIRHIMDSNLDGKFVLIYSNKNRQHISYREELDEIQHAKKNIFVFNTLTRLSDHEKSVWKGYDRRIDAEMIKECLAKAGIDSGDCYFYLCGGLPFLKSMTNPVSRVNPNEPKGQLDLMGIGKDKIKIEIY